MAALGAPKLKDADLAANYGWSLAVLNSDKELKALFRRAVKGQFTPERFKAELKNTWWYQKRSESQRKYEILKRTDPAQYVSQVKQVMASIADQYSSLTGQTLAFNPPARKGTVGTPDAKQGLRYTVTPGSGFLFTVADQALKLGMNEAQIRDSITRAVDWRKLVNQQTLGGSASGQLQAWRQAAAALGVKPSNNWYAAKLKSVSGGNDTNEGVLGGLKQLAKQRYAAFADDIENGATMSDLTENYRQSMGTVLEISPSQVDVFDKHIQAAVAARDKNGQPAPLSINDFEKRLRQDERWKFTKNANDSLMQMGHNIVKSFGLASV